MVSLGAVCMSGRGKLGRFKSWGCKEASGGSDITGSQDRMLATELYQYHTVAWEGVYLPHGTESRDCKERKDARHIIQSTYVKS